MEKVLKRDAHTSSASHHGLSQMRMKTRRAGRNREACSKAAQEKHPSPRTQWRVRDRKVAAEMEVQVKREERMRSHGTDVTPVR